MVTNTRELAQRTWDPFEVLSPFGMTFGRLFDDMLTRRPEDGERLLAPSTDVWEDDDALHVSVELPGMKKEDIQIRVENNVLSISGEKCVRSETPAGGEKAATEGKKATLLRSECRFGSFHRLIALPEGVNSDASDAEFRDGVLTIRLPKTERVKPKVLKIK